MTPPIKFPDPRRAVRDRLRELLAGRSEPYAQGAEVSVKALEPDGAKPFIRVHSDGRYRDASLNGRATVRLVVWHEDSGLGEELAGLCEALLLADSANESLRGCNALAGPRPSGDPDTGEPMSYLTVTARLRPITL